MLSSLLHHGAKQSEGGTVRLEEEPSGPVVFQAAHGSRTQSQPSISQPEVTASSSCDNQSKPL